MSAKYFGSTQWRAVLGLLLAACAALPGLPACAADEELSAEAIESIARLERQLAEQERTLEKGHPEITETISEIASLYIAYGVYERAILYVKGHLADAERLFGKEHINLIKILDKLASLYIVQARYTEDNQDRYTDAELLYKRILAIREKQQGGAHPDMVETLRRLAELYQEQARYADAERLYKWALEIQKLHYDIDDPVSLLLTSDLANFYINQVSHADVDSTSALEFATDLNKLAEMCHTQALYDDAERFYEYALTIREQRLAPDHFLVAESLKNLAEHYHARAIAHAFLPKTWTGTIGYVYAIESQTSVLYAKAGVLWQRYLKIQEKIVGADSPTIVPILLNITKVCEHVISPTDFTLRKATTHILQDVHSTAVLCKEGAEPFYKRALEIRERTLGANSTLVAQILDDMGNMFWLDCKYDKALLHWQKALKIWKKGQGKDRQNLLASMVNLESRYEYLAQMLWVRANSVTKRIKDDIKLQDILYEKTTSSAASVFGDSSANTLAQNQLKKIKSYVIDGENIERIAQLRTMGEQARDFLEKAHDLQKQADVIRGNIHGKEQKATVENDVLAISQTEFEANILEISKLFTETEGTSQIVAADDKLAAIGVDDQRRLVTQILSSKSIHPFDKIFWIDILPTMNQPQVRRLKAVLANTNVQSSIHVDDGALYSSAAEKIVKLEQELAARERELGDSDASLLWHTHSLAKLYHANAQYDKAERLYRRSLAILDIGNPIHPSIGEILSELGRLCQETGRYDEAETLYTNALKRLPSSDWHEVVSYVHENLVWLHYSRARYTEQEFYKAKALYSIRTEALSVIDVARASLNARYASILRNEAALRLSLAQYSTARILYLRAWLLDESGYGADYPNVAKDLNGLAALYTIDGNYAMAEAFYFRSQEIIEKAYGAGHLEVAPVLSGQADLYKEQAHHAYAERLYKKAQAITEKDLGAEHPRVADSLNNLARLYRAQARYADAEPLLLRALPIAEASGEPELLWEVQGNLRELYAKSNPNLAIFYGKQAVNTLQGVRAVNTGLDRVMQQSFVKSRESHYTGLADLLFAQGRLAEGEQVLAMLKESEYHDFIERSATQNPKTTRATLTEREKKQLARYQEMSGRVVALAKEYNALATRGVANLNEAEKARKAQLREQLEHERGKFEDILKEIERDFAAMGREQQREFDSQDIAKLNSLSDTLEELGHGAVLLSYLAAKERLWIVLTTAEGESVAREVNIKAEELNKKIGAFREAITNRGANVKALGRELHELLIAPVAGDLQQAGAQTLMLSLTGALRYLPFAALHDGESYLAKSYALAVYTEAAKTKLKDRPQPEWRFAGFGVTKEWPPYEELKGVRKELDGIRENALRGSTLYDEDFNAESLRDALEQSPPVVHVASHFEFKPGGTQRDSYLLLGDGTHLALNAVKVKYRFKGVDLVTLSACQTAMGGDEEGAGREVEGLGTMVQDLGAKGVLATLWKVADESTADFMQRFYRYRQQHGMSKAEALRQAQLDFIGGKAVAAVLGATRGYDCDASGCVQSAPPPKEGAWTHPYHWAPFILMGNWL